MGMANYMPDRASVGIVGKTVEIRAWKLDTLKGCRIERICYELAFSCADCINAHISLVGDWSDYRACVDTTICQALLQGAQKA